MPPLPTDLLVPMVGVVMALLLFAGLLQLGLVIVRALKLPNDLPEGPHFEPPPPAIQDVLSPVEAARIAAHQARLRHVYGRARSASQSAQVCAELAAQSYSGGSSGESGAANVPDPVQTKVELMRLAALAKTWAEQADQAVRQAVVVDDDIDKLVIGAEKAAKEAQSLAARFPSGRERRLRLMLIVLVMLVVWIALMYLLMPTVR